MDMQGNFAVVLEPQLHRSLNAKRIAIAKTPPKNASKTNAFLYAKMLSAMDPMREKFATQQPVNVLNPTLVPAVQRTRTAMMSIVTAIMEHV